MKGPIFDVDEDVRRKCRQSGLSKSLDLENRCLILVGVGVCVCGGGCRWMCGCGCELRCRSECLFFFERRLVLRLNRPLF